MHPIRQHWIKGVRSRAHRTDSSEPDVVSEPRASGRFSGVSATLKNPWYWLLLFAIFFLSGTYHYQDEIVGVRQEIVDVLERKGLTPSHPVLTARYGDLSRLLWLPSLRQVLDEVRRMPNHRVTKQVTNPEPGDYLAYIRRHGKPFDAKEALLWESRRLNAIFQP